MSVEEWEENFGKVYRGMIDAGVESVMIGHIRLPEMSRKLRPGIKDNEIMPATIAPELLQDLLRDELGFNGLVITDATHMVGLTSAMRRAEIMPYTIAVGCDMILYYRDKEEDIEAIKEGLANGVLTEERLNEAVTRILAFKAMLKLHTKKAEGTLVPAEEGLSVIGCEEHKQVAKDIADQAITLVKNTKNQLPLTPETHKRIMLYTVEQSGFAPNKVEADRLNQRVKAKLEAQGFEVTLFDPAAGLNGKQLLAAYALGACGVQVGTCLLASEECPIHDNYKQAIIKAKDTSTTVTGRIAGTPVRIIKNKMAKEYIKREKEGADMMELEKYTLGSLKRAVLEGDVDTGSLMAGQVAGMVNEIKPVATIIKELFDDCNQEFKRLESEF